MVYLVDFDTQEKIDSIAATDSIIVFQGPIEKAFVARIEAAGNRFSTFFVQPNETIEVNGDIVTGGQLNALCDELTAKMDALDAKLTPDLSEEEQNDIFDQFDNLISSTMKENIDNPLGYYLFLKQAYDMNHDEINSFLEEYPSLKEYKRVQDILAFFDAQDATAVGQKFTDFTVTNQNGIQSLSDYVGKQKLLLVDMWASWCGPCRRESKTIKELYEKYHDQGLEVLGVAVWDDPENTLSAIEQLELPWPQIIDAGNVPTDIYGVFGIPFIMLISEDGTILARNIQGEELVAAVEAAME